MARFKSKPSLIEAEQFFSIAKSLPFASRAACAFSNEDGWHVITAHGRITKIVDGDWIVPEPDNRGFYPIKPDIFAKKYEPAPHLAMVCGVDCQPGDSVCNNYCNEAPQKGPMASKPPAGPDA